METGFDPKTMAAHEAAVQAISATVRRLHARKESFRIFHGSTNSTRPAHQEKVVDISRLSNVLRIDKAARTAIVEPNVPMDRLVTATLKHGLIPPVVMEFPGITVGGGYSGSAGESSSFKYGYFDQTVNRVEIVLGSGEVVQASKAENPDLFKGAAGALGTLGVTTMVELQLKPAKRFVKTTYHKTNSIAAAIEMIQRETSPTASNDYVDGIIFSKDHGVVISGKLTDDLPADSTPVTFSRPWDPWYYMHVKQRTSTVTAADPKSDATSPVADYVPIAEYLFRYDRGGFWVGLEAFRYFPFVPFNRFTRWFLNDFMHTRMLYRALQGSNMSFGFVVQDLSLPYSTVEDFINYSSAELDIWPLWLCPLREMSPPSFHPSTTLPHRKDIAGSDATPKPMLNIGLWGRASHDLDTFVAQNRRLEARLSELGGRKVLYSHAYYTEDEFWALYNRDWYLALREKYSAGGLPTVFDKIKTVTNKKSRTPRAGTGTGTLTDAEPSSTSGSRRRVGSPGKAWSMWPFAGIVGIRSAIRSGDYLLHRNPEWREAQALLKAGDDDKDKHV